MAWFCGEPVELFITTTASVARECYRTTAQKRAITDTSVRWQPPLESGIDLFFNFQQLPLLIRRACRLLKSSNAIVILL